MLGFVLESRGRSLNGSGLPESTAVRFLSNHVVLRNTRDENKKKNKKKNVS